MVVCIFRLYIYREVCSVRVDGCALIQPLVLLLASVETHLDSPPAWPLQTLKPLDAAPQGEPNLLWSKDPAVT